MQAERFTMKKIAYPVFALVAALALTACGSSDPAKEGADPDTVEIPAEEAMSDVDAMATPAVDASGLPADEAAPMPSAISSAPSAAVEAATAAAEKKM